MWNKHSYNCKQIQRCFKNKYKTAYDSQQLKSAIIEIKVKNRKKQGKRQELADDWGIQNNYSLLLFTPKVWKA